MSHFRHSKRICDFITPAVAIFVGLLLTFPIFYGIFGAFKSPAEFSAYPPTFLPESFGYLENFRNALTQMPYFRYLLNSSVVALLGTTMRLAFAILAAYAFAFYEFRGKRALFFILLATMMFPADTLVVTNYLTITRLGLLNTYLAMSVTSFVGAAQMFMLRQNFRTMPRALREAAELDGCGDLRFLWRILLPMSRPVVVTLFIQSFITIWNSYLWPLLVTSSNDMRTIQVGVAMLTSIEDSNYYLVLAGATLSMLPSFLLFIILRRNITKSMEAGPLTG